MKSSLEVIRGQPKMCKIKQNGCQSTQLRLWWEAVLLNLTELVWHQLGFIKVGAPTSLGVQITYSDSGVGRILPSNETVDLLNGLLFAFPFEPLWSQLRQGLVELLKRDDTSGLCPTKTHSVASCFCFLSDKIRHVASWFCVKMTIIYTEIYSILVYKNGSYEINYASETSLNKVKPNGALCIFTWLCEIVIPIFWKRKTGMNNHQIWNRHSCSVRLRHFAHL